MPVMESSELTPRAWWAQVKANPNRAPFGFGRRAALINIDLQCAYTEIHRFKTAYQTDPRQLDYVNDLSDLARRKGLPVIWTYIAFLPNGQDAGPWGTRSNTPDSLQNIKEGSERAALDPRLSVDRQEDAIFMKRMPSAFHDTPVGALLTFRAIDTVVLTGGSTSGCVRATAVDALSRGYRVIVPEECVADRHEIPHYANLCDLMLKYADVEPYVRVRDWFAAQPDR